jgi:hypothetical protein
MTLDAKAQPSDLATQVLSRIVATVCEDAIFALAAAGEAKIDALEGVARRRSEAYAALVQGTALYRMTEHFDYWLVEMARAMAPIAPPVWMPMSDVVREKVTLEIGARGLRSLFSSKPSEKEVLRVKRLGTLAVRTLRAVFASDSAIGHPRLDAEEERTIAALIGSLGLSNEDSAPLSKEPPIDVSQLDVYGEIDPAIARALLRGAWMAAAWDAIDPREEAVIRTLAQKTSQSLEEVEAARAEAVARVDARKTVGLATVDAIRFVLSDRVPGPGVQLAAHAGTLVLPRRYREEALAQIGHGAPVTLARRYPNLSAEDRQCALGIAWAAALHEDPTLGRRALLRARYDRVAADLGDDGARPRTMIDTWLGEVIAPLAASMR